MQIVSEFKLIRFTSETNVSLLSEFDIVVGTTYTNASPYPFSSSPITVEDSKVS